MASSWHHGSFWLFPKLKEVLKDKQFSSNAEVQIDVHSWIKNNQKTSFMDRKEMGRRFGKRCGTRMPFWDKKVYAYMGRILEKGVQILNRVLKDGLKYKGLEFQKYTLDPEYNRKLVVPHYTVFIV